MPRRNRNNIPDLLKAMPVKVSVKVERSPSKQQWEAGDIW